MSDKNIESNTQEPRILDLYPTKNNVPWFAIYHRCSGEETEWHVKANNQNEALGAFWVEYETAVYSEIVNIVELGVQDADTSQDSHEFDDYYNPVKNFDPKTQIAVTWHINDVLGERPDLTSEQALTVLRRVAEKHDANLGISWTTLKCYADEMFPA